MVIKANELKEKAREKSKQAIERLAKLVTDFITDEMIKHPKVPSKWKIRVNKSDIECNETDFLDAMKDADYIIAEGMDSFENKVTHYIISVPA